MRLIERDVCAVSGYADLEALHRFKSFPVFMGCTDQPEAYDIKQDMNWCISRGSGLIQLNRLLPLEVLYPESHGAGAIGALWESHHRAFANFMHRMAPTSVLEIGGGHGILSRYYHQLCKDADWTIVEPNPFPVEGCRARFIRSFFDENFRTDDPFDAVVHSHVFEHIYNPDLFMRNLGTFVEPGKQLMFSLPRMQVMLERKYTNCINFEHTLLLTEPYVELLLSRHGFRVVDKEYFMEDHSIFYAAVRDPATIPSSLPDGLYDKNRSLYLEYLHYHEELVRGLNEQVELAEGQVYLFGAHVFAQYLIAFGLDTSRIVCLLDNDPRKQGRRLYGTGFSVRSPRSLQNVARPVVILKAGVYNEEIRRDILDNINPETTFL
jgi:SAM-dependent methyltransferase